MYECGFGTKQNFEKALYWYNRAAQNGNQDAAANFQRLEEYLYKPMPVLNGTSINPYVR